MGSPDRHDSLTAGSRVELLKLVIDPDITPPPLPEEGDGGLSVQEIIDATKTRVSPSTLQRRLRKAVHEGRVEVTREPRPNILGEWKPVLYSFVDPRLGLAQTLDLQKSVLSLLANAARISLPIEVACCGVIIFVPDLARQQWPKLKGAQANGAL